MDLKLIFIAAIVLGVLWFAILGPGGYLSTYFQQQYFRQAYQPARIEAEAIGDFPSEDRVEGVPWISYQKAYCASTALQMIAYLHGMEKEIGYYNFLMGFTYGAYYSPASDFNLPYTDPISGLIVAAPYLGLEMRYLTTGDAETFLEALRFYLSEGYPVLINLNAAKLLGRVGFFPHSELLVGYDEKGFTYFETFGEDRAIEDGAGIRVSNEGLVEIVREYHRRFNHPWRFSFISLAAGNSGLLRPERKAASPHRGLPP